MVVIFIAFTLCVYVVKKLMMMMTTRRRASMCDDEVCQNQKTGRGAPAGVVNNVAKGGGALIDVPAACREMRSRVCFVDDGMHANVIHYYFTHRDRGYSFDFDPRRVERALGIGINTKITGRSFCANFRVHRSVRCLSRRLRAGDVMTMTMTQQAITFGCSASMSR